MKGSLELTATAKKKIYLNGGKMTVQEEVLRAIRGTFIGKTSREQRVKHGVRMKNVETESGSNGWKAEKAKLSPNLGDVLM